MSNQIKYAGRKNIKTKSSTKKNRNITSKKGGKGHMHQRVNKSVKKRKIQRGGWGGFVYGIGFGAILYKWFNIRDQTLNNKE
jgi:hypothetical protein